MDAKEKYILDDLIGRNSSQFVIPVFQRNYVWGKKDCKRLFDDILNLAEDDSRDRPHFIGALVYRFNRFIEHDMIENVLIDGQQRLTTIIILLKAMKDHLKDDPDYKDLVSEITNVYLINQYAKKEKYKLKLKPNKTDGETFQLLMNDQLDKIDKTSFIYQNYNFFINKLPNLSVEIRVFFSALKRLQGVSVMLGEKDNPQLIFESLNSTGIDLTDVDLIRNYLLMSVDAKSQDEYYENYWIKLEYLLGDNLRDFIRDYLTFFNGVVTSNSKNKVYTAFRIFYEKLNPEIEMFLKDLVVNAEVYNQLINPTYEDKEVRNTLIDYRHLKMGTTFPFLFGILRDYEIKEKITPDELVKIIRLLESYVVRRNIVNLAGGGLTQLMASMYKELKNQYNEDFYVKPYEYVSSYLMNVRTKAYFPKNEEFIREFINRDMYHNRNIRYILSKLESSTNPKERVDFTNLTIEHVLPQKINTSWMRDLGITSKNDEKYDIYKDRIGNLTLTAYNSEMSSKSFNSKKKFILESKISLNQYFKNLNKWDFNQIDKRGEYLSEKATVIWSVPPSNIINIRSTTQVLLLSEEIFDFTGTKPSGIQIKNKKVIENNWSAIFIQSLKHALKENTELFCAIIEKQFNSSTSKSPFARDNKDFRQPVYLKSNLYVETNNNTEKKIEILKDIYNALDYEEEEVILFID